MGIETIVLAGGLNTRLLSDTRLNIPKGLVSLGNQPMICILLYSLLEVKEISQIHVLVPDIHREKYKREICRWIHSEEERDRIHVVGQSIEVNGTGSSIEEFLKGNEIKTTHVLISYCNLPLLSTTTFHTFLRQTPSSSVLCFKSHNYKTDKTSYARIILCENEPDHVDRILDVHDGEGEGEPKTELMFLGVIRLTEKELRENISKIENDPLTEERNITDMIRFLRPQPVVYQMDTFRANREAVIVNSIEDKIYAEHLYIESKHNLFLNQCYWLWNECTQLEKRVSELEKKLLMK